MKGSSAIVVVFDMTRLSSFYYVIGRWKDELDNHAYESEEEKEKGIIPLLLIGNKIDLEDIVKVTRDDGNDACRKTNAWKFIATSAKTGANVDEAFTLLARYLIRKDPQFKKS